MRLVRGSLLLARPVILLALAPLAPLAPLTVAIAQTTPAAPAAVAPAAGAPRAMTIVDLIDVPTLGSPQLSPDGRQVLYVLARADWKQNKLVGHVWRVNVDGTGAVQMTNGAEGEMNPRWSPDGKWIAFGARRAGGEGVQIHLIPNGGGEARPLTKHATSITQFAWAPDGSAIWFLANEGKTPEEQAKEKDKDDVFAYDEDYRMSHLWTVAIADGVERRITEGSFTVSAFDLSRDGSRVLHFRAPNPLLDSSPEGELWLMAADGSGARRITNNTAAEGDASLSPNGSRAIFTAGTNARFEPYYNGKLFLVSTTDCPREGCAARLLTADLPHDVQSAWWSKDGSRVYLLANMGVRNELFELDPATGRSRQLTDDPTRTIRGEYVAAADAFILQPSSPTDPGDVWVMPAGGTTPRRVTRLFESIPRDFRLPRAEVVTWKGADGVTVEGILYYPLDHREGVRHPLVVQTHGGPASSDQLRWTGSSDYIQVLAARGYAVLRPNYRGSTGYGDAFLRDMVGGYFRNAHTDVMAGVDHLIRIGLVDSTRMAKMGWSAGGHMTNKIITFTSRFRAASSGAGASNWTSMYGQSDIRTYRTPWFGGTPWQRGAPIETYWEHSPLKYAANAKTPTLFLVGQNDARVPMPQSVEMYRALKSNGVPTHLYVAPREGHGWQELRHRLFKANVELAWFERWVTGRDYVWEKPPADSGRPAVAAATPP